MFRPILNNKIGELLNYLAHEIPHLSLTKALKLLYLIDEHSVRQTGVQVTWLDYKVWKKGPVSPEIYHEFKHHQKLVFNNQAVSLEQYVQVERTQNPSRNYQEEIYLVSVKPVNLSEFSEQEQEIIKDVVTQYGRLNATDLVALLHKEGTLWDKHRQENQLQTKFDWFGNTSNVSIDFSDLVKDDPIRQMAAQSAFEALHFQEKLLEN